MADVDPLRYPIGQFQRPALPLADAARQRLVAEIEQAPATIGALVRGLTEAQLDIPYRPGGWTVRQVVHHVPDSHLNGYVRMKLAATESTPAIKVYQEALWAELPDSRTGPIDVSLALLDALHRRWVRFLRALTADEFQRTFTHPQWGTVPIEFALAIYAWHGRHHAAHITQALNLQISPSRPTKL
jgi:hypothetical protein